MFVLNYWKMELLCENWKAEDASHLWRRIFFSNINILKLQHSTIRDIRHPSVAIKSVFTYVNQKNCTMYTKSQLKILKFSGYKSI